MTSHQVFFERLQSDRKIDVAFWKKHPELKKQLVDDLYSDRAHVIYELLQNAEYAIAKKVDISLFENRFTFSHDGEKLFSESNIEAITDVSKSDKVAGVRRFGIGFKSVFKYTDTPYIQSGPFSFRIVDFVFPEPMEHVHGLDANTHFEFPFKDTDKAAAHAFAEIEAGLDGLAETTLLFLSNIKLIRWKIGDSKCGEVERIPRSKNHFEIQKKINGQVTASAHFLLFDEPANGMVDWRVAVAYALEFLPKIEFFDKEKPLDKQMKIVPANPGRVAILLPAKNEKSGLRFHLNAPFDPELSRASIKEKNSTLNAPLFQQLARLTAVSLHKIHDLNLLTVDFLAVLPNPLDSIEAPYNGIFQAIVTEMKTKPLTPTHNGKHAAANNLVQSRSALKNLLSIEDVRVLFDPKEQIVDWAKSVTSGTNQERFLTGLGIREWKFSSFISVITTKASKNAHSLPDDTFMQWLASKDDEWHQQLYSALYDELKNTQRYDQFDGIQIVRLGRKGYGVGRSEGGGRSFFPSDDVEFDELMPRVARGVYSSGTDKTQQEQSKAFLVKIGVRDVDEAVLVEDILRKRYTYEAEIPDTTTYLNDLVRFITLIKNHPPKSKLFADYFVFEGSDAKWRPPSGVFLDIPFLDTCLSAYYEPSGENASRVALASSYEEIDIPVNQLVNFAVAVGAQTKLPIGHADCRLNPDVKRLVCSAPGNYTSCGTNEDFTITGLKELLKRSNIRLSRLVWKTAYQQSDSRWTIAQFRWNRSQDVRESPSQLICVLRDSEWVPQSDDRFVRPADADRDLLPLDFPFVAGSDWLKAIRFGEDVDRKSEAQQAVVALAKGNSVKQKLLELVANADEATLAQWERLASTTTEPIANVSFKEGVELLRRDQKPTIDDSDTSPTGVRNPERYQDRLDNNTRSAVMQSQSEPVAVRFTLVSTKTSTKDAREFLYLQYGGKCQVSGDTFTKASGRYYFEAVFIVPRLGIEYLNDPGNMLCLSADWAAKFMHASFEWIDDFNIKIRQFKAEADGGTVGDRQVRVRIAGEDAVITWTERHFMRLKSLWDCVV